MSRFRRLRDGEPMSAGRGGGVASCLDTFRKAMFTALFFAGVMLVNGIIAILVIGFLQSIGVWETSVSPASEEPMSWQDRDSHQPGSRKMQVDPVIAMSPIEIGLAGDVGRVLPSLPGGRPLVIDYFASRHAGLTVGDITVAFADAPLEPRYVEIMPVAGVRVLVERHLLGLLADGATLAWAPHLLGRHLSIHLDRPERWLAFLESHPRTR